MGLFKSNKKANNIDLVTAYKMVYEDLCNSDNPLFQGKFDPNEKDEEYLHGIGYVITQIGIKAYKADLTVVPSWFAGFTNNILRSCIKHGTLPKFRLEEEKQNILIRRLRTTDDKVLNFFADMCEKNRVIVKMCDAATMCDIATGKAEYPLANEEE